MDDSACVVFVCEKLEKERDDEGTTRGRETRQREGKDRKGEEMEVHKVRRCKEGWRWLKRRRNNATKEGRKGEKEKENDASSRSKRN